MFHKTIPERVRALSGRDQDVGKHSWRFGEAGISVDTGMLMFGTNTGSAAPFDYKGGNIGLVKGYATPVIPFGLLQGYSDGLSGEVFYVLEHNWIWYCPANGTLFKPLNPSRYLGNGTYNVH